uniref:DUF3144 domain-containing protein n=1 Tax=uncultured Thiotrichaceae bacterium TaxID=298394 RepID=A0A6S6UGU3_9GAMM|nr:MAG: Unknown protein [uncultured Thiotrichaceae bacterium]
MADDTTFYKRADAMIHLANEQVTGDVTPGDVSASAMFAIARYNAYISAIDFETVEAFKAERDEVIKYFTEEYQKMLTEHIDDYTENFDQYTNAE